MMQVKIKSNQKKHKSIVPLWREKVQQLQSTLFQLSLKELRKYKKMYMYALLTTQGI